MFPRHILPQESHGGGGRAKGFSGFALDPLVQAPRLRVRDSGDQLEISRINRVQSGNRARVLDDHHFFSTPGQLNQLAQFPPGLGHRGCNHNVTLTYRNKGGTALQFIIADGFCLTCRRRLLRMDVAHDWGGDQHHVDPARRSLVAVAAVRLFLRRACGPGVPQRPEGGIPLLQNGAFLLSQE